MRQSFKEFFTEALDKPFSWKWHSKTNDKWIVDIDLPTGDIFELMITKKFHKIEVWELDFYINGHGDMHDSKGQQFKIFATVKDILSDFMKKKSPDAITFDSSKEQGDSRSKLYSRFAKQIAKKYNMYVEVETKGHIDKFILRKKK